tara:strand:- start:238 stop:396 length:159 start_codon:yes stop_codon:yes gene_type:complete
MLLESVIRGFLVQRIFMTIDLWRNEISLYEAKVWPRDPGKLGIVEFDSPGMR